MGFDVEGHEYCFEFDPYKPAVKELQRLYANRTDVIRRYPNRWVRNRVARDVATHYVTRLKLEQRRDIDWDDDGWDDYPGLIEQMDRAERFVRRCLERQQRPTRILNGWITST